MKIRNAFIYVSSFLLIIFLVILLIERTVAGVSFSDFSIFRSEKHSAYTIADEVGDLYLLNTSEYRMKMIFPFDFVKRDVDWWKVKHNFEQKSVDGAEISREMLIYSACLDAGFDPTVDIYDFIVLTAVIKAGINISGTAFGNPELFGNERIDEYIQINEQDNNQKNISIYIPEVEITDYYIEDRKPDNDNFPDAELTPRQWRDLVNFINPLIQEEVISLGILENAEENSRLLIEKILKDSGFSEVNFVGKDL